MKKRIALLAGLATFLSCSLSNASVTNIVYWDDGDGAIICANTNLLYEYGELGVNMAGTQYWGPGHMLGTFDTDTAEDPTIKIRNELENDTAFAWDAFHVNVFLSKSFTLTMATNYLPGDWTANITAPVSTGSNYMGQVDYYAGTPVGVGDTFDFGYKISFSGATQYAFCQELIPIPEPATLSLMTVGLLLGGWRVARRRNI